VRENASLGSVRALNYCALHLGCIAALVPREAEANREALELAEENFGADSGLRAGGGHTLGGGASRAGQRRSAAICCAFLEKPTTKLRWMDDVPRRLRHRNQHGAQYRA